MGKSLYFLCLIGLTLLLQNCKKEVNRVNESNNNNITVETLNNSSAKPEDSATENQIQDVSNSPEVNKSADSPNDFLQSDSIKNKEGYKNNYNGNYYILATVPNAVKTAGVITNESYNLSNDYGSDSYIQNEFYGDHPIFYDTYYYEEYYPIYIDNDYYQTDSYDDNYYCYPSYPTYPNHRPNRPRPPHKPKPPVRPELPIIKPEPPVRPHPPTQPQPPTEDIRTSERPRPESTTEIRLSDRPIPESSRKPDNANINRPSQGITSDLQDQERREAESRRQREQQESQEQERREAESRRQRDQQEKQEQERREAESRHQREQQERQEQERREAESRRQREQQERQEQERREAENRRQREQQEKQDQERREAESRRQREQQEQRERQERERQNTESSRRR